MKSILIVDDIAFTRMMLKEFFVSWGFDVIIEADSGENAVRNYHLHRPSLVLMDISMPGMDGLTASEKIMQLDQQAKIIICSAVARRDTIVQAIRAGACDFITKPLQKERIEWSVRNALWSEMREKA